MVHVHPVQVVYDLLRHIYRCCKRIPKASEYQAIWLQQTWKYGIPPRKTHKPNHTNHLTTKQMVGEEQMKMTFKKMSSKMILGFDDVIYSSESIFRPNPSHLMRGMEIFHTLQLKKALPIDKC